MKKKTDLNRSLNELLGFKKIPGPYPTSLVEQHEKACDLPLKDLNPKQILTLIGQRTGLEYLMPWAIQTVSKLPLLKVEYYAGDLLCACLKVNRDYWVNNMDQWNFLSMVLGDLDSAMTHIEKARIGFENEAFQP